MQDKRLVDRLSDHWNRLRGDAPYPQFERLNSAAIADLWDRCIVLEVENTAGKKNVLYTYQHMGKEVIKAYGADLAGHYVNVNMHNFPGWQVLKSVDAVFAEPGVQMSQGSFVNDGDQIIKYRACIMPFGRDEKITHALVGLSWKMFQ